MMDHLKLFLHYLSVERGLARNSLEAYERDLTAFLDNLQNDQNISDLKQVARVHIVHYMMKLRQAGRASSTVARTVTAIRGFFKFLAQEQIISVDPAQHLETPKRDKKLPKVMDLSEVERLLRALTRRTNRH